jgi:hypothetical protein
MRLPTVIPTALALTGSASAALVFTDASFENGGTVNMNTGGNYAQEGSGSYDTLDNMSDAVWNVRGLNNGTANLRNGGLETTTGYYNGQTTAPAGATGNQFYSVSRGDVQLRGIMQYVNDGAETTGQITINLDYWVHEVDPDTPRGGEVDISYEIFAFNDPSTVSFISGVNTGTYDTIIGSGFISSGDTFTSYSPVSAATGFQTLTATLDLGTGYQYVGVAIGVTGDAATDASDASATIPSFDNLRVVPEPGTVALLGLGGLALILRRSRCE